MRPIMFINPILQSSFERVSLVNGKVPEARLSFFSPLQAGLKNLLRPEVLRCPKIPL